MKKYNFVYKTTNLINGKIYIGVHSTDNLNDGYFGSGIYLNKSMDKYGKHSFKNEILKEFNTADEAYLYESELVDENFVKRLDTYNLTTGGKGGYNNISSKGKQNISKARSGMVTCIDINGNKLCVSKEEFDIREDLFGNTFGFTTVRDIDGTFFQVPKELAHLYDKPSTGLVVAIDLRNNERVTISKEDFDNYDYYVGNTYGSSQSEESNLKRSMSLKGKPNPKKKFGTCVYCNKHTDNANLKRWHNENCKHKN